ncbi:DUF3375 domain-containing protein [Rathayibacter tritici]|uniref:Uncharacterized protein n=1 Tax=Rathayibacter tritici TaxID=33888 RepID=A0A160KRE7_9MICO|nr:DUF3375 domain-containing protein [Rathayibacter tritici]AND16200.1 hypothetical protein A6122_1051 [Rathayibacter tritici]PPF31266.1 DUF3375 domain-containing protein [Rathayibacter tritici]PPF69062.1 DUF3375 domain-containing protein [Rathayibacter tritici]PPG07778.1 DUF3375 domain-containing protein [Rathayibacter tritici]PPI12663.1 DUF3375 domain-containing protein [Rathayibacter tritici]
MSNSRAEAAYLRSLGAFRTPTLDLLHGRYAPFVVAALSLVFTVDRHVVAVADAHAEVGELLEELRSAGYDEGERALPSGTARELCRYWVRVGWLVPQIDGEAEVYRLSAHAVSALEITGRTGGGRTRVSNSRVRTLLEAVERLAADVEPDPQARLARLREERARLDAEIGALEEGAGLEPIDDEQLLEEAENVVHLARELPADFARVAESIKAMQRDVVADLRRDVRPTGDVLREYLERGQHVMQATSEGRAFAGALRLLGDAERIDALADQLHTVLVQPFSRLMDPAQRAELSAIGRRVELGVQEVLTAQRRASHVITGQVRTHDPARDRQVDELLREVMAGLQEWTGGVSPDAPVAPLVHLPVAGIGHLRQTLGDVRPAGGPAPLAEDDAAEFIGDDSRAWGGPRYAELEAYVAQLGDEFDLGDAFSAAPEETRRPVDLLGLLEIAHRTGLVDGEGYSVVSARRPDGTTRRFAFGSVTARTEKETDDD